MGIHQRSAHFTCTLVYLESADDPEPLIAVGKWHGQIIDSPKGASGFGYDPLFLIPELGKTAAELSPNEKNKMSHRALALEQLMQSLKNKISA